MSKSLDFLENYKLEGKKRKILTFPSAVLGQISSPVSQFDDDLKSLCKDMLYTMYKSAGIGLAAVQIGILQRIFVIDISFEVKEPTLSQENQEFIFKNFNPMIFINPHIKPIEGEILYEEGCLSIPGIYETIKRVNKIEVTYNDLLGNKHTLITEDTLSVCIQHENDHLDGIIFIDKLSPLKKRFLKKRFSKKLGKNNE